MDFAPFVVLVLIGILQGIILPAIYRATVATFI
jgi:YggT family protein